MASLAVVALIGWFVVSSLLGRGPSGAATPEAAVEQLVKALEAKDPTALAALVNPHEVTNLTGLVDQVRTSADETGMTVKGRELEGFTVDVRDLETTVTPLSQRIARVSLDSGLVTFDGDPPKVAAVFQDLAGSTTVDLGGLSDEDRLLANFMLVKEDRGWFVSPMMTMAEWMSSGAVGYFDTYAAPLYLDEPVTALTEPDPETAVRGFLTAVSEGNVDGMLQRVAPGEQTALVSYAGLWRSQFEEWVYEVQMGEGASIGFTLLDAEVVDLPDGAKGVTVDRGSVRVSTFYEENTATIEGNCVVWQGGRGAASVPYCADTLFRSLGGTGTAPLSQQDPEASSGGRITFVAVPAEGGYAVSILGSLAASGVSIVSSADPNSLASVLGLSRFLEPVARVAPGESATFKPAAGRPVSVEVSEEGLYPISWIQDGNGDTALYDPSGNRVHTDTWPDARYLLSPGTHTLVLDPPWTFDPGRDTTVTVGSRIQ